MSTVNSIYYRVKFNMVLMALVIIGAINWGTTAFGYNLVEILNYQINSFFRRETYFNRVIYVIIALAAIRLAFQQKTWLPFLGYSAFPSKAFIPLKENKNAPIKIEVKVKPNTRVAYWASLHKDTHDIPYVDDAYGDFSNSGVVMSDKDGIAILSIKPSTSYIIPSGREIPRHVHYRMLDLPLGMMGNLRTAYY
jgi:uncharacterized membrane protein YuzA (DUF378 family)